MAGSIRDPAERAAAWNCKAGWVDGCLRRAALHRRVSYPLLRAIARCEAGPGLNPRAVYGNAYNRVVDLGVWLADRATGLLMFKPSTFAGTPYMRYGKAAIFSAKWNALAGAWLLARVGTRPWLASRHCWA